MRRTLEITVKIESDRTVEEIRVEGRQVRKMLGGFLDLLLGFGMHGPRPGADTARDPGAEERGDEAARPEGERVSSTDLRPVWHGDPGAHYADAEDTGQHDTWKREALFALWRFVHAPDPGNFPRQQFGLDMGGRDTTTLGPLFPVSEQLAEASRRLGFDRLFLAALGRPVGGWKPPGDEAMIASSALLPPAGAWDQAKLDVVVGVGSSPVDLLRLFHEAAEAQMHVEGAAVIARNVASQKIHPQITFDPLEVWIAAHTLGPVRPTTLRRPADPTRNELHDMELLVEECPELEPLRLPSPV